MERQMKKKIAGVLILILVSVFAAAYNDKEEIIQGNYTVHEWGTFTSVSTSDGRTMNGLYLEEEKLPQFVDEFEGDMPKMMRMKFNPLVDNPVPHMEGVNIKMETPVIYFYSKKEMEVDVNVKFAGGIINQWYPASVKDRKKTLDLKTATLKNLKNIDFRKNYTDSIDWKVKVLSPDSHLSYTSPQNLETPTWVNPRFTDANMLQIGKDREKFIFYRGLARFDQPLKVTAQSSKKITLQNIDKDDIGFALVYEYKKNKAKVWWTGAVKGDSEVVIEAGEVDKDEAIYKKFQKGLEDAGLYKKEAASMLETWRHSYFEKEGLRVFWIVPRRFTDKILPLKLNPAPKNLERVLVGRTEVMTPEFEEKLAEEFVTNTNASPFWYARTAPNQFGMSRVSRDRFLFAWQQRAKELIDQKNHQFSFLREISKAELPFGSYYIWTDKEKRSTVNTMSGSQLMKFKYYGSTVNGSVEYFFPSEGRIKHNKEMGVYYTDRKAVFNVKMGKIDGEVKIYNTSNKGSFVGSMKFKEGVRQ
jgi:hypothetical protein